MALFYLIRSVTKSFKQIPIKYLYQYPFFGVKFVIINQKKSIMLKQFFILCSGADKDLLEGCSEGEQTKYVGIGATVFFTAVMAFIASAYALFTVFDSVYPALLFGLVWSLLIFNLDRFIVFLHFGNFSQVGFL